MSNNSMAQMPHPLDLHSMVKEYIKAKDEYFAEKETIRQGYYDFERVEELRNKWNAKEREMREMVARIDEDRHSFIEVAQEKRYNPVITASSWPI